jgi:restriction system protein
VSSRDELQAIASSVMVGELAGKITNFVGQTWALRSRVKPDDLVVLPLKTTKKIAVGVCSSGYQYLAAGGSPSCR